MVCLQFSVFYKQISVFIIENKNRTYFWCTRVQKLVLWTSERVTLGVTGGEGVITGGGRILRKVAGGSGGSREISVGSLEMVAGR